MALIYRASLVTEPARSAVQLEGEFAGWLRHKRLPPSLPVSGARRLQGGQEVYRASHAADGIEALRLSLAEDNAHGRWRTTCTAVREDDGPWQVVIDLDRTGGGPPPPPLAPVLVRRLLGPGTTSPEGTPLRSHAVAVGPDDVDTLLDAIRWDKRDVPVVVAYDEDVDRVEKLADALAGVALVVRLAAEAPSRFNESAGAGYRLRRGAWRTFLPGACADEDDPRRHRALAPERIVRDGEAAVRLLAGSFRSSAVATPLPQLYREKVADIPGFRSAERLARREAPVAGSIPPTGGADVEEALIQMVESLEREVEEERAARRDHERERDEAVLDTALSAEELSRARSRLQRLERELLAVDVRPWDLEPDAELETPIGFAELVKTSREQLSHLVLGSEVESCLELEDSARAATWVVKVWEGLLALQSFAEGRMSGGYEGNFEQWCRDSPPGARTVSANIVAMSEHERVQSHKAMRRARTFQVPEAVDASGSALMWAHIKIDNRDPAPRIHFLDDTRGTGKVYVGYIGKHLLSPKTT
jgi:hypothetical protein